MSVTKFPKRKVHQREIRGKEIYAQEEPPQEMVWDVCPYLNMHRQEEWRCMHCPQWEEDPDHGKVQRGCYGLAAEVCRIIFARQKRMTMT